MTGDRSGRFAAAVGFAVGALAVGSLAVAARAQQPEPRRDAPDREAVWLRVTAGATAVGFGVGFDLTVERGWDHALRAEDWSDDVLAPLDLTLVRASRRDDAGQVEETRRYRARLFRVGEVLVAAPWFRARAADGDTRVAFADDLVFEVSSSLDPADPGAVELPGGLMPAPFSWRRWAVPIAGAVAAGLGLGLFVRRRLARRAAACAVPELPAADRARARLVALGAVGADGREGHRAFGVAAAAILREYIGQRFDVGRRDHTTEELLRSPAFRDACGPEPRARVEEVLARCDLLKFAFGSVDGARRAEILGQIEEFVRATSEPGPEGGSR